MRRFLAWYPVVLAAVLLSLGALTPALATPELGARFARSCDGACHGYLGSLPQWAPSTKCSLSCLGCHVSPVGGGLRNDAGFKVGKDVLSLKSHLAPEEKVKAIQPKLGKYFRYGADLRLLRYAQQQPEEPFPGEPDDKTKDSFFLMESYAYFSAEPLRSVNLVLMQDIKNDFGQYFLLIKDMPLNSYFMVGRFDLPFGLKVADHTSYTRAYTGFDQSHMQDGVLWGFQMGRPYFNVAYTNGSIDGYPNQGHKGKQLTVNAGYQHEYFSVGGQFTRNEESKTKIYGGNLSGTVWKFSYLGEYNIIEESPGFGVPDTKGRVMMHQLNFYPLEWLNVKVQYDFFDYSEDLDDEEVSRWSAGLQFYPLPFTEFEINYRAIKETPKQKNDEVVFIVHGYF